MPGLLANQAAVITGSAVGIGRAIAVAVANEGADVALLDIDAANNAETAELVRATGRRALALDCDVADSGQARRAIAEAFTALGRVDLLVNNAAVYINCALTQGDWDTQTRNFERSVAIAAFGTYYCGLAAVPLMRRGGGGNIVNLITEHVHEGHYMATSPATGYDVGKFGQWRLTEAWAIELKPHGIRVNALCPGATDTPMLRAVSVPIAERGMRAETVAEGVLNIIRQGPDGPVGKAYLIGTSRSAMSEGGTTGPADVAAILSTTF
jgi:NAD(P)-dependent dehydrogenase (short-subunit alcohol dehydrogenase family)